MNPNGLPTPNPLSDKLSHPTNASFTTTSPPAVNARLSSINGNNYLGNKSSFSEQEGQMVHNYQPSSSDQTANKVQRVSYLNSQQKRPYHSGVGVNNPVYRSGSGAERLTEYVILQQKRPPDNNIQFWRNLVADFFAPSATKRWCISSYKDTEEIDDFFKVQWKCNMCHSMPCYGFESNEQLLPSLHQIKNDVGILKEQLQLEKPFEYQGENGQIFLRYHRATLESEYQQVQIVHHGQLRVVLSPDLKICSWEFCAERHKEYIDRTSIISQACQLVAAMKNYQHSVQNSSSATPEELKRHSDEFISSADQMLAALGTPSISRLDKSYVRCIQISKVLNVMRNLILYSQEHGLSPKQNLVKVPHPAKNVPSVNNLNHQFEQQKSSTTILSPNFKDCVSAGRTSGLYGNRLGGMKTSSFVEPIHHKTQHTSPRNLYAETPIQTPPICFPTPSFDTRPQIARTVIGKTGIESAAEHLQKEPRTSASMQQPYHLNFDDPDDFYSIVDRIIQGVKEDQSNNLVGGITGGSDTKNKEGNMVFGSNDFGGSNAVTSNRIGEIDAENYQFKTEGIHVSAPKIGTTSRDQMDADIFPKDDKGNYLPPEYNEELDFEFVNFGDLSELLE